MIFEERPKRVICDPKFCDMCRVYVSLKSHLKPLKGGNRQDKKNGRKEKRRKE